METPAKCSRLTVLKGEKQNFAFNVKKIAEKCFRTSKWSRQNKKEQKKAEYAKDWNWYDTMIAEFFFIAVSG